MDKDTPKYRESPRYLKEPDDSLKILNLGVCLSHACLHHNSKTEHYHGLAYTKRLPTLEIVAEAEKTLRAIGFEGVVEVESMPLAEWKKRSFSGDWL